MLRFAGVASALFAVSACGKVDAFTDAGTIDSTVVDSVVELDARNTGNVTVTAHARNVAGSLPGDLIADVQVFVVQPDGTLGDSGTTDVNGEIVLADVQQGAAVTAIYTLNGGTNYELVTWVGVKPGDSLNAGERWDPANTGTSTTATVNYTPAQVYCSYVMGPCGYAGNCTNPNSQITGVPQYDSCQTANANLLLLSQSNTTYQLQSYRVVRNVAFGDGAVVNMGALQAAGTFTASFTGIPSYVIDMSVTLTPYLGSYHGYTPINSDGSGPPVDGAFAAALPAASGVDYQFLTGSLQRGGNLGDHRFYERLPGDATSAGGAPADIPWLGVQAWSGTGRVASWTQYGTTPYDAAYASVNWNVPVTATAKGAKGGPTYTYYQWNIILPPGVTAYSWGNVPEELEPFVPPPETSIGGNLYIVDFGSVDGYDDLRAQPEWVMLNPYDAVQSGQVDGRAVIAEGAEGFFELSPQAVPQTPVNAQ